MSITCECASLDSLIGGELEAGVVTLVYGVAGAGKTNLALQLARSAAKAGKKTFFIDTEGVSVERMRQLFNGRARLQDKVLFSRVLTLEEQMGVTEGLAEQKVKDLGLVVEDSVNGLARLAQLEEKEICDRQFQRILSGLASFAHKADIPVLLTSQVWERDSEIHPFFYRSLSHLPKTTVKLEKIAGKPNFRRAVLDKHRSRPEKSTADFEIAQGGLVC